MVYDFNIAEMPIPTLHPKENFDRCKNCLYYTEANLPYCSVNGGKTPFNVAISVADKRVYQSADTEDRRFEIFVNSSHHLLFTTCLISSNEFDVTTNSSAQLYEIRKFKKYYKLWAFGVVITVNSITYWGKSAKYTFIYFAPTLEFKLQFWWSFLLSRNSAIPRKVKQE